MTKLKEIYGQAGKVGWELEAWFRLRRAAQNSADASITAALIEDIGQSEVMGSDPADDTPGFTAVLWKNGEPIIDHTSRDRESAERLFESWLE